jgi:hypothetical protein
VFLSYAFSIFILIYLYRKIAKTHIDIAENFEGNNEDYNLMRHVFLNLILLYVAQKTATTRIILAQNFGKNNADFE